MDVEKLALIVVAALACPLVLPLLIDGMEVEPCEPEENKTVSD